jgi:CelD/BcsL family acetyltransferase involved in cellulose biosynthesis
VRIEVLPAASLTADLVAAWSEFQLADPALESPFLRPEFSALVASVRPDVFVAVLEDDRGLAGFFPFQRDRLRVGWPVGGMMSNYQAVIARQGVVWDAVELVGACRLVAWEFDHLLASQAPFLPFHRTVTGSPYMDVSAGFPAYADARRAAGSEQILQALSRRRRFERTEGPVRLEAHTSDPAVLATLLAWKDEHHRATRRENVLRLPWISALLEAIAHSTGPNFAGMLSALYIGDRLAAAHLGLRSRTAWHYYVTSYDHGRGANSPGIIMLVEMARVAPELGIRVIDLGKGQSLYKDRLASGATPIAEGAVDVPSLLNRVRHLRLTGRTLLRRSPIASPLRAAARSVRRRGWLRE